MELYDLQEPEEYLAHFSQLINQESWETYPKLSAYYQDLYKNFLQIIEEESQHFLSCMRKVLLVDAKIQMLIQLKKYKDDGALLTENEIIEISENTQFSYYRELLGKHINDEIPWMLICMSDWPNQLIE
jgi:hypothetical protein